MALLGLLPPYSHGDVRKAYKERAKQAHPDRGGDPEAFNQLRHAYDRALEYVEFRASRRDWLANQVEQYTRHLAFVDELEALGCDLAIEAEDWRQRSWGEFAQVTESILAVHANGPEFGDPLAESLDENRQLLESIRLLDFGNSGLADSGLLTLTSLKELLRIDVRNTPVTVEGLSRFCEKLQRLETVHIGGTSIGWLQRLKLRRSFPEIEFVVEMKVSLDASPRTRFSHLAELALG
jgi:hypothetical protein